MSGGEGEIRTRGTLSSTSAFEAGAFNHSATSPHSLKALAIRRLRTRSDSPIVAEWRVSPAPPVCCTAGNLPGQPRIHIHFQGDSGSEWLREHGSASLMPCVALATLRRAPGWPGMLIYSCGTTQLRKLFLPAVGPPRGILAGFGNELNGDRTAPVRASRNSPSFMAVQVWELGFI